MFHAGTTERRFIFRSWRLNFPQKRLKNRTKVRSKIRNEFSRQAHFRRIFAAIFQAQRNIVRKFARIRTIGVPKIRRNIAELSFQAKLRQKAPKSPEKPGNSSKCGSKTFGQYCTCLHVTCQPSTDPHLVYIFFHSLCSGKK